MTEIALGDVPRLLAERFGISNVELTESGERLALRRDC